MTSLLTRELVMKLDKDPRVRRAWLSPGRPLFLALISESGDGSVRVMPKAGHFELPKFGKVQAFAFRPRFDKTALYELAAATDSFVERYELESGIPLISCPVQRATAIAYSSCGGKIAAGNSSGLVTVFDLRGDKPEEQFCQGIGKSAIAQVSFSACGDKLFILTRRGELFAVELMDENPRAEKYLQQHGEELLDCDLYCIASHSTAQILAVGGSTEQVYFVNPQNLEMRSFQTAIGMLKHIDLLTNSEQFVLLGTRGAEVWRVGANGPEKQVSLTLNGDERILCAEHYDDVLLLLKQ